MRIARWLACAALPVFLVSGCQSMNNTERGAVAGGGIGAGTGALVGHAVGNTGAGAVIGGLAGALVGGAVGNDIDKEKEREARLAAAPPPLQLTDVASMAQQHISDPLIINQIRTTGSAYHLTADQIVWLRQQGVSEAVIAEMQATAYRPVRRVYTPEPVVIYESPPPPVSVGVGIGFRGR